MRMFFILMLAAASISLSACSSMRGNVIPQTGPNMEQMYDSMGIQNTNSNLINLHHENDLEQLRQQKRENNSITTHKNSELKTTVTANAVAHEFHKLPNPELTLYVYPHLAGSDQVPIPGYYTAFNVYEHDYYALPSENN